MQKKMTGLFAALIAFGAFALVPAISSAHGLQDTSGGVTTNVTVGSKIVAYNESGQTTKFSGTNLTVECNEVTMTGSVAASPHTATGAVQGTIEDVWFRHTGGPEDPGATEPKTQCTSNLGATTVTVPGLTQSGGTGHWCVKTVPGTDNFNIEPRNCGGAGGEFTFQLHAPLGVTCTYKRAANITGTFTTTQATHTAATLTMTDNQAFEKEEPSSGICPAEGKLSNFKFELFTDKAATGPEWRNAASVAEPVWIT